MKRPHGGVLDPTVLDFSANVNPLGPPDSVRLDPSLIARYPSPDADPFCRAAAERHGVPRECILAGNGSCELVYLVARHFAGGRARIETPAFTEYEDACEASMIRTDEENADVVILANPTSPEGRIQTREAILARSGTLVVDEAFLDFAGDEESFARQAASDPRLVVIRTLTKFYALAGLRIGYLVAVPEFVSALKRIQPPWSVNGLAQAAGIAALGDRDYAERTRRLVRAWREALFEGLGEVGLEPLPSAANFILCRVHDASRLCRELALRGIAARQCDSFTGLEKNRYVRFAVRRPDENERLLGALREVSARCPA